MVTSLLQKEISSKKSYYAAPHYGRCRHIAYMCTLYESKPETNLFTSTAHVQHKIQTKKVDKTITVHSLLDCLFSMEVN